MKTEDNFKILLDIMHAANQHANRPAMVIEEETYTYKDLIGQAKSISHTLCNLKESVIGITAENRIETYASILAVLLTGKTYVMLHPDIPIERNRQIALQAGLELLLYSNLGDQVLPPDICVGRVCTTSYKPTYMAEHELYKKMKSNVPAYLIFTSGSTGDPKGVPISRNNLDAFYEAYQQLGWQVNENDRMLQMFELTFDVSVVSFLYPLTRGACVYTVPQHGLKYLNILDILERHQLTFAAIAPSVLRLSRAYFPEIQLPALRYLVVTAEATDLQLLGEFRPCIPNATVINLYGPTEATIYCTSYVIPTEGGKHHNGMAAIGKPFPGMEAIIANEKGHPLPPNQTGELWISGPQIMQGYWQAPEKSASCFVYRNDGKLFYRTGDRCQIDEEGDIIYCGRMDNQVKIQGFRIELGEIEYRVKQFYRNLADAVVLPICGPQGNYELHLAIERNATKEIAELEAYLQYHLPPYMLPKQIHLLNCFPLNKNNKTDRKKILQIIQNKDEYGYQ